MISQTIILLQQQTEKPANPAEHRIWNPTG